MKIYKTKIDECTTEYLERWHYEGDYLEIMRDIKKSFLDEGKTVTIHKKNTISGNVFMVWIEEDE